VVYGLVVPLLFKEGLGEVFRLDGEIPPPAPPNLGGEQYASFFTSKS